MLYVCKIVGELNLEFDCLIFFELLFILVCGLGLRFEGVVVFLLVWEVWVWGWKVVFCVFGGGVLVVFWVLFL